MSKFTRTAFAAALSMIGLAAAGSQSQAAIVYMNIADIHPVIGGIAGYNAGTSSLVALGGVDDFLVTRDALPADVYANAHFVINSGFSVLQTIVADANGNGIADAGDRITSRIGSGSFDIVNPAGIIVHGTFTTATLASAIGSSTVTLNVGDTNGLDLTAGAAITSLSGITDLTDPESFAINVIGIDPGVTVSGAVAIAGTGNAFFTATLDSFGIGQNTPTSGSIDLVANYVPEPASLSLLGLGTLAVAARRRRA